MVVMTRSGEEALLAREVGHQRPARAQGTPAHLPSSKFGE